MKIQTRKKSTMRKPLAWGLAYAVCLLSMSAEAADKPAVSPRLMDRLEAFKPYPGHYVLEKRADGERFILVTLPEGETKNRWTRRLIISVEPPAQPNPQDGLKSLLATVELPYETSCAIEDRFFHMGALTQTVGDDHLAREVLTGCARLKIPRGVVRELSYSRLIVGPQGGFNVQWSERTAASDEVSREELDHLSERMDSLDPFAGRAVRKAIREAEPQLLDELLLNP